VADGVFHAFGQVRMSVASPQERAWWQNVELTGYFRYTAAMQEGDQAPHWELLVRNERHSSGLVETFKLANCQSAVSRN
jgi:hypothetical protein